MLNSKDYLHLLVNWPDSPWNRFITFYEGEILLSLRIHCDNLAVKLDL
jgi:hypothetical protein